MSWMARSAAESNLRGSRKVNEAPRTLEARITAIESIAGRLESDRLELDDALQLFEQGVAQLKEVERILATAELRVERAIAEADGSVVVEAIEGPGA